MRNAVEEDSGHVTRLTTRRRDVLEPIDDGLSRSEGGRVARIGQAIRIALKWNLEETVSTWRMVGG